MQSEAWVINASPLILFARLDRLDLFERLAPAVIVPETVIREVAVGIGRDRTAAEAVAWAGQFRQPDINLPPNVERWDLGPGESQASLIACRPSAGPFWMIAWLVGVSALWTC